MKTLVRFLFLPCIICTTHVIFGQGKVTAGVINVQIYLPSVVKTNDDLNVRVKIINKSGMPILVYKDIVLGDLNNELANLSLEVEKKKDNRFVEYSERSFFDPYPRKDTIDNIKKTKIAVGDSVVNYCHADNEYRFEIGHYRMRCLYRNSIFSNERFKSNWVYFKVIKKIFVKHYSNGDSDSTNSTSLEDTHNWKRSTIIRAVSPWKGSEEYNR